MLGRWLRLWFGFSDAVDRGTYFQHGVALTLLKYAVDALLIWSFAGLVWTPLDYLNPVWSVRHELLQGAPAWLMPLLVGIALPFLWIGVGMTMRRAVDAGATPWIALLFFIPLVNFVLMGALSVVPSKLRTTRASPDTASPLDDRLTSAMLGVAAATGITLLSVGVGIYMRRSYSAGLFLGVPFTVGYISSYIYNYRSSRPSGQSVLIALASVTIAAGAITVFALEGFACVAMALPLAWVIAWPGAVLGRIVATRGLQASTGAGMAMIAPLLVSFEPRAAPSTREVITVVEIAAPPDVVWRHVVSFPELKPPQELLFRAGIAAPLRARIDGTGVGAVRYCDFTTGSFVEPITAWQENRLLAFDITSQAPPMDEWSPYPGIKPPHRDGYFRATRGEFRLDGLPGGHTRLEGRTAYVIDMFPQAYWAIPARVLVTTIHGRVLDHIKQLAEEEVLP